VLPAIVVRPVISPLTRPTSVAIDTCSRARRCERVDRIPCGATGGQPDGNAVRLEVALANLAATRPDWRRPNQSAVRVP
jgi:hypothetical protein